MILIVVTACDDDGIQRTTDPSLTEGWQQMSSGSSMTLRAVWGSSKSDVFAVGDNGTILHFDGSRWRPMSSGTTEHLHGVSGTAPDDVYAGGDNGTALRYDGFKWKKLDPGTTNDLGSVNDWWEYAGGWATGRESVAFVDRDRLHRERRIRSHDGLAERKISRDIRGARIS